MQHEVEHWVQSIDERMLQNIFEYNVNCEIVNIFNIYCAYEAFRQSVVQMGVVFVVSPSAFS